MEYRERVVETGNDLSQLLANRNYDHDTVYPMGAYPAVASNAVAAPFQRPLPYSPAREYRDIGLRHHGTGTPATRPASPYGSRHGSVHLQPGRQDGYSAGPAPRPPPSGASAGHGDEDVEPVVTELNRDRPVSRPAVASSQRRASSPPPAYSGNFGGGSSRFASTGQVRHSVPAAPCASNVPAANHQSSTLPAAHASVPSHSSHRTNPAAHQPMNVTIPPAHHSSSGPPTSHAGGGFAPPTATGSILSAPLPPTDTLPHSIKQSSHLRQSAHSILT